MPPRPGDVRPRADRELVLETLYGAPMASDDRLLELLRVHGLHRGTVVLSSGRQSDFFVDCKQAVLKAEGHVLAGGALLEAVGRKLPQAQCVAGVELGGCPLASAVALLSWQRGRPMDAVYVRKEAKGHGTGRTTEGDDHLPAGTRVAVLEDVVTTAGSTLHAIDVLRTRGFDVVGVIALVDRDEGGADALRDAGIPFEALYGREDFVSSGTG